ncbi:MAG: ABC transporter ATP-binding protein [Firmicutes bacterium]|nr:ABC transporter ATP-binding protein [Bacillota bacterium]
MAKLEVKDVEFSYACDPVIQGVCLSVSEGEVLCIVGPNGAGKSTLLKCIDRILFPQKGTILLDGLNLKEMKRLEVARKMGYIPQRALLAFPVTVFEVVLMGRHPHAGWKTSERDIEKVLEVLQLLKIEDLAMRDINELSGGQQQNVFFAKALAQEPEVLLLDEPTSNLDIKHQLEVMEIIKSAVKERGITAIISLHDLNLAARYSDKVILMKEGGIFAAGEPRSVLTRENIKFVYGVEVIVVEEFDVPWIIPLAPIRDERG